MVKKLLISLVLCLSLLATVNPILAQADQKSGEDILAKMQREGWKILERRFPGSGSDLFRDLVQRGDGQLHNPQWFCHRYR